jgi:hypothetical protein
VTAWRCIGIEGAGVSDELAMLGIGVERSSGETADNEHLEGAGERDDEDAMYRDFPPLAQPNLC